MHYISEIKALSAVQNNYTSGWKPKDAGLRRFLHIGVGCLRLRRRTRSSALWVRGYAASLPPPPLLCYVALAAAVLIHSEECRPEGERVFTPDLSTHRLYRKNGKRKKIISPNPKGYWLR